MSPPPGVTAGLACFFLDHGTPTLMEKPPGADAADGVKSMLLAEAVQAGESKTL